MNIFDILGPIMVGPSSSHTAGAVRIGYVTRSLFSTKPVKAKIYLHGSFAATGKGHGTDRALIAGLLGMGADDERIPRSFEIAEEEGLEFEFHEIIIPGAHPNTAILEVTSEKGTVTKVQGSSIGGGRITINKIDELDAQFSGEHPTLIVHHQDFPGVISRVTKILADSEVNIGSMHLYRGKRGGQAVMIIETDGVIDRETIVRLRNEDETIKVTYIHGGY
ncbi:MAG: L-serine ammonia-lyase, iron-sulfur-dependent subunit beta [Lachnospiraceae bacterium]|jgi:L-serine dehydratase|nr:L-serine ammonia-lyase, iron-sulfur-dependent subunit beta [Lachnospiraceae bacterium]MDD3616168.1 L-serine ammonia-lyase, iron-sulfur-dependent subunit beta [Lachnospiraceae bacterium]